MISYIACGGYICLMASFIATVGDGALDVPKNAFMNYAYG